MFKINPLSKSQPNYPSSAGQSTTSSPDPIESTQDEASHSPFTEEQIRKRAHQVWKRRIAQGKSGTPKEDWQKAIEELQLSPFERWWAWTGIPDKKGWDLLTSVSLPLILFLGGSLFTYFNNEKQQQIADATRKQDLQIAEDRRKQDLQIADDNRKQETFNKYLEQMAEALNSGLLDAKPGTPKFTIAQARTVTALLSLDKKRQNLVIQFLGASGLSQITTDTKFDDYGNATFAKGDRVILYRALMKKANLVNSDLSGALLIGAFLSGANLGCAPPESKEHEYCSDLSGAGLPYADLTNANLRGADLSDAVLEDANLSHANLSHANLTKANLTNANFWRANLSGAIFKEANLYNADFSDANLWYADLRFVKFSGADLSGVNLKDAILLVTDLADAKNLTLQQLIGKDAPLLCHVRFPDYITGVDPYRDCDRLPEVLMKRFPRRFAGLQSAQKYVNEARQWSIPQLEYFPLPPTP